MGTPYGPITWKEVRRPHVQLQFVKTNRAKYPFADLVSGRYQLEDINALVILGHELSALNTLRLAPDYYE